MLKSFTRIAAFILAFGVSVSLVGLLFGFSNFAGPSLETNSPQSVSKKIHTFLRQDVRNGRFRTRREVRYFWWQRHNGGSASLDEYYRIVNRYVEDSSSMDDSFMPADLKYAWRDHMKAWAAERQLLADHISDSITVKSFSNRYDSNAKEINATWYQVLRIAERYGADTRGMR